MFLFEGTYDPSEYENLNVSQEIKELFAHVMRYTPQTIDLETRFKPFIPEYIPAVGDIDAFIKVRTVRRSMCTIRFAELNKQTDTRLVSLNQNLPRVPRALDIYRYDKKVEGCVIPHCNLQRKITQPILRLF